MTKKFLWLLPYFPFPATDGGKVRIYNLIKNLSKNGYEIYLISYIEPNFSNQHIIELEKYCKKVFVVERKEEKILLDKKNPRCCNFFNTLEMISEIKSLVRAEEFDFIQIDFLVMSHYFYVIKEILTKKVPIVYTEHDVSYLNFEKSFHDRDIKDEKERFYHWGKIIYYIKKLINEFNLIITLTEEDKNKLILFQPKLQNIEVVPTGVDIEYFYYNYNFDNNNLMYLGHYKHYPNYDAAKFLVEKIFPKIKLLNSEIKLFLVGSGIVSEMLKFCNEDVIVTGEVEDVRNYFYNTKLFVSPIRLGEGIKGKILEAMSCGVPVVTFDFIAEAMKIKDVVSVAKDEVCFVEQIIKLFNDKNLCKSLSLKGRDLVEKNYDWKKIVKKLDLVYNKILQ